ncbi:MAG: hypothetical protein R3D61_11035 [Defluviimonas denitrificans]
MRAWPPGAAPCAAAIGGPREEATAVVLSLGLGLSVWPPSGRSTGTCSAIARDLPDVVSYFFVDIQPGQIDGFRDKLAANPGVTKEEDAPMLRGC